MGGGVGGERSKTRLRVYFYSPCLANSRRASGGRRLVLLYNIYFHESVLDPSDRCVHTDILSVCIMRSVVWP